MSEKILVIHPDDNCSADRGLFEIIYEGKGYDVIVDADISDEELAEQLCSHDMIFFIWIVGDDGLMVYGKNGKPRYMINDTHVHLLRGKRLLSIGGKGFFERNGLPGLHTDTIITSGFQACLYDMDDYTDEEIKVSLMPLLSAIRDAIEIEDPQEIKRIILDRYNADDAITQFNRRSIDS